MIDTENAKKVTIRGKEYWRAVESGAKGGQRYVYQEASHGISRVSGWRLWCRTAKACEIMPWVGRVW